MKEKIQKAEFNGIEINKDTIAKWLDRDLDAMLSLLFAMKNSQMIKDIVVEWLYENHIASKLEAAARDRRMDKEAMENAIQEGGTNAVHE